MNIKWNKVTWYSKALAIILFIFILPSWTFYLGTQYEEEQHVLHDQIYYPSRADLFLHTSHTYQQVSTTSSATIMPQPVSTSVMPDKGPVGTLITIRTLGGLRLSGNVVNFSEKGFSVVIGNVPSSDGKTLKLTIPNNVSVGVHTIDVLTKDGSVYVTFTVTPTSKSN